MIANKVVNTDIPSRFENHWSEPETTAHEFSVKNALDQIKYSEICSPQSCPGQLFGASLSRSKHASTKRNPVSDLKIFSLNILVSAMVAG